MVKNTSKLLFITLFLWLWFPGGDPTDIIVLHIVANIGIQSYILLSILWVTLAYVFVEGKGISGKFNTIKNELKQLFS